MGSPRSHRSRKKRPRSRPLGTLDRERSRGSSKTDASGLPRVEGHLAPAVRIDLLIVDRNADTVRIMARLFRLFGYSTRTAVTYSEAVGLAAAQPPDVLICASDLFDGSGIDLFRWLRGRYRDEVRAIAVTGAVSEENDKAYREAGFDAFFSKPADLDLLSRTVQDLVRSKRVNIPSPTTLDVDPSKPSPRRPNKPGPLTFRVVSATDDPGAPTLS
jgi:DNA-binding response OmpR family regulator